ncbi:MAG: IreB family regulatory phosphoprotein [Lachnospiraceae bacterium]|nr:IreB family regulatory phosphoprotein [Lachnospiraceae bacterium]
MAVGTETQYFNVGWDERDSVNNIIKEVYNALKEKGYNPVNQIVGYIMSGDPTYITSYKGARSLIMKVERDELVEEMLLEYIFSNAWDEEVDE